MASTSLGKKGQLMACHLRRSWPTLATRLVGPYCCSASTDNKPYNFPNISVQMQWEIRIGGQDHFLCGAYPSL